MTLTAGLIDLIERKPTTPADLKAAALFALDALANAYAGRTTAPGRILLQWAARESRDAGRQAFVQGGLTHILETDDLHRASVVHPGCVVVPAAFAVARREGKRGRAVLAAVLKGFEACCRVGRAVGAAHYRIWHNTATCGPYGSAFAAGALIGLDDGELRHALGNAGTQSAGLWEFLATGAMSKHLHAGRAAEAGVVAADLARLGFTGPPAILEGPKGFFAAACPDADPDAVLRTPDAPWEVHATSIKPWPSCRHTHPAIDAALELAPQVKGRAIAGIDVVTYPAALDVCDRPRPTTDYEAKFSLQHCVAAAVTDGQVGFASFDAASRQRLAPLRERIALAAAEPYASAYPKAWGAHVAVRLADGTTVDAGRRHAKGDPEAALSEAEMIDKARGLLTFAGVPEPERIIEAVLGLTEDGPLPPLPVAD